MPLSIRHGRQVGNTQYDHVSKPIALRLHSRTT
jgi:hypothetical protein